MGLIVGRRIPPYPDAEIPEHGGRQARDGTETAPGPLLNAHTGAIHYLLRAERHARRWRTPGKVSGAWVFANTRIPLFALHENLAAGATVGEFVEWFPGIDEKQVRAVLEHEAQALKAALAR